MANNNTSNLGAYVSYAASLALAGVVRVHGPVLLRKGYVKLARALKTKKERKEDGKPE